MYFKSLYEFHSFRKLGNSTKLKEDASADFDKPENRPERGVSKKQKQADGKSNYSIADLLKQVWSQSS